MKRFVSLVTGFLVSVTLIAAAYAAPIRPQHLEGLKNSKKAAASKLVRDKKVRDVRKNGIARRHQLQNQAQAQNQPQSQQQGGGRR